MGVSRNGLYDYLRRQDRDPDPEHEEKLEWVRDLAEASDHTYGSRRMAKALQALGYEVGRHQARSLMREAGVWVRYRRRYRATTNSNHRRVKLNSDPWERTGIREIGYCYPMGAGFGPIPMRGG